MNRRRVLLLMIALAVGVAGCTGDAEKGINKHKEMPVAPSAAKQDKGDKK